MTIKKRHNWKSHGESAQSDLIAGLLPSRGVHFIVAEGEDDVSRAITADLVAAVAGGNLAGGLSTPDAKGRRRSTAGFFGQDAGEPKGVAVIGGLSMRDIEAAAMARGIQHELPIYISEARQIADNLIGAVKAFILRKFGRQFGDVTPGQLRALALAALRSWDAPTLAGGRSRYSVASDSGADAAGAPLFTKAKNALHDFVTNRMAGKVTPLALVPARPLFLELAANLPSARHYLRTKEAMDAMRNNFTNEVSPTVEKWGTFALRFKADNRALMDLMHDTTIAQIDPSKSSSFPKDDPRHAEYLELRMRCVAAIP